MNQWLELKLYFQVTRQNDKCYTSEILYAMYNDEKNFAFLVFLNPILKPEQNMNKLFESKNIVRMQ